tara:strand:- start:251 stop:655 length:405 start_codon:yes stop_codon:yes gene_type:complete
MKKSDLKQIIKPLVKECIHEVLLEEGLLSNVVAEVAKGLQQNVIVESQSRPSRAPAPQQQKSRESTQKINQYRQSLMDSIGGEAYNGVNLFEGTDPMTNSQPAQGHPDLGDPRDAGVDITAMMDKSNAIWQALK